jgi:hypothetical protein
VSGSSGEMDEGMDRDETIALFERCEAVRAEAKAAAISEGKFEDEATDIAHEAAKAVWNDWAEGMLAQYRALETSGRWVAQRHSFGDLEARNEETRKWMDAARVDFSAQRFVMRVRTKDVWLELGEVKSRPSSWQPGKSITLEHDQINLSGFIFPGTADFDSAQFTGTTRFEGARFYGAARFRDSQFSGNTRFHQAQFLQDAEFQNAQFLRVVWFRGVQFTGQADFEKAQFSLEAWFDETEFADKTGFGRAEFSGEARFHKAQFAGIAEFHETQFAGIAWFDQARFSDKARFDKAEFSGNSWFHEAQFLGEAWFRGTQFFVADFQKAEFASDARFHEAQFAGETDFRNTQFGGDSWFWSARFSGDVDFEKAQFARNVWFTGARFGGTASFTQVGFDGDVFFSKAYFGNVASFRLTAFPNYTTFEDAHFARLANFNAIRGGRAFDLAGAHFDAAPDFVQAYFEEPPRLDNVSVRERVVLGPQEFGGGAFWKSRLSYPLRSMFGLIRRVFRADRNLPARWRALKRFAINANDTDRGHEFFARELEAARFAGDWPVPWPPSSKSAWSGFFRFWFGAFYGLTSDYGRSVALPLLWWCVAVLIGAMFYLGEHEGVGAKRFDAEKRGAHWTSAYIETSYAAWRGGESCIVPVGAAGLDALAPAIRSKTRAPSEAFELALRTGLIVLDPGPDIARRIYGCLYGVERFGETVAPVVPSSVSYFMVGQKFFCALMILLFGLSLYNMLKMR